MHMHSMTNEQQDDVFRHWVSDHIGLVMKVVRGFAAVPEDQDDLFQETLLQLWRSIPAFRAESKETTWIYRVAFNTALAWHRGEHRRRNQIAALLQSEELRMTLTDQTNALKDDDVVAELYAAIHQLSRIDASLALMHLDGLSYHEIAEVLGISENHVGVKLNRVKKQLAQLMKGVTDEL
jgi:RNA polymerase sigma-70 factor, ECF subfamily